jgi:hypothetical protein
MVEVSRLIAGDVVEIEAEAIVSSDRAGRAPLPYGTGHGGRARARPVI